MQPVTRLGMNDWCEKERIVDAFEKPFWISKAGTTSVVTRGQPRLFRHRICQRLPWC